MFFSSWASMGRILVVGTLAYLAMVVLLRVSGKRTLSKMNAFDMIITVALGSCVASAVLDTRTALLDGILAFGLLIGLQLLITWLSVRSTTVSQLVKAEPQILFYDGRFMPRAMKRERVTESEILSALRQHGLSDLGDAHAVVLETQGSLSVIRKTTASADSALADVGQADPNGT